MGEIVSLERGMRKTIIKALRPLDAVSIENGCAAGTPDVNFVDGWVELKSVDRWPPRGGPLRIEHFTNHQRVWLLRRRRAGGQAFLLLKVGQDWLLFDGQVAARELGHRTRDELFLLTIRTWARTIDAEEMIECLSKPLPPVKDSGSSGDDNASQ
jgi:hypothetical protein